MVQFYLHRSFRALIIALAPLGGYSQSVLIPDLNLRAALNEWVPGAVDANGYLDPDDPAVSIQTELEIEVRWSPADLTGLDALDQLSSLTIVSTCLQGQLWINCNSNSIQVPTWPASLTELIVNSGTYAALPAWPPGLQQLELTLASIASVPSWPASLIGLKYNEAKGHTQIPLLPGALTEFYFRASGDLAVMPLLPDGLERLTLRNVVGGGYPALPSSITTLELWGWSGAQLPTLPDGLLELTVYYFEVTSLPALPNAMQRLLSQHNQFLVELPMLPTGLVELVVTESPLLTQLPALPPTLDTLSLVFLGLQSIPDLPEGLRHLDLAALPDVGCLPLFPNSLERLNLNPINGFLGTGSFACFPNSPPNLLILEPYQFDWAPLDPSRLCTTLNSTCEFVNPAATGTVYWDQNANGARDPGEPGYHYAMITFTPGNIVAGVQSDGSFNQPLPLGQYTATASSNNPYVLSITPFSHNAPFVNPSDVDANNDFGVVLQPNVQDLRIDQSWPWGRPGYESDGWLAYENIGTIAMDGTVTLELDADLAWVEGSPAPSMVMGQTITWNFMDLQVGESRMIHYTVYTDAAVPLGTDVQHTATIGPVVSDEDATDNVDVTTGEVVGSFDPNDKRVEPTSLTPAQVAAGSELEYTIRFQNTGTYQADRVIITDTLSADLQWSTMRLMSSSHPCTWTILGNGVLRFTFDPIVLPDSTSDEPNSHGFVKFAMKPSSALMNGESVGNVANIYFDYNEPVITNEAVFTVDESTSIRELDKNDLQVWPNPVDDEVWVEGTDLDRIEILDVTGRVVRTQVVRGSRVAVDVSGSLHGAYVLRAHGPSGWRTVPFLKR